MTCQSFSRVVLSVQIGRAARSLGQGPSITSLPLPTVGSPDQVWAKSLVVSKVTACSTSLRSVGLTVLVGAEAAEAATGAKVTLTVTTVITHTATTRPTRVNDGRRMLLISVMVLSPVFIRPSGHELSDAMRVPSPADGTAPANAAVRHIMRKHT